MAPRTRPALRDVNVAHIKMAIHYGNADEAYRLTVAYVRKLKEIARLPFETSLQRWLRQMLGVTR